VTSISDVCANTLGVVFGAAAAAIWVKNTKLEIRVGISAKPIPLILLAAWTAFAPTLMCRQLTCPNFGKPSRL